MDGTTLVGIAAGLIAIWATLVLVLWLIRPRGVGVRELVRVVPDVLAWSGT